ncbi:hypothetical protein [Antrihabitans sp. YC2-6]|uniref:hypothetical protein n=1 Tax=Antrihabitans sp. YC2-6 TaxID=2799498 RepID=UPI0018F35D9F|nr:hypothetical protein [Antrihabitans sp. YC2-6]MBJ8346982.1 hypothetical protein [Antrihabitans sp. YC2-6]
MQLTIRRPIATFWAYSVASLAGCTAILAFAGAAGLILGVLDVGDEAAHRIPFDSPALAGIALVLIVGVPMTATAWLAISGDPRAATAAIGSGLLLVAWIAVQIAIIKELSLLQPSFVTVGVLLEMFGLARQREWWPSGNSDPNE